MTAQLQLPIGRADETGEHLRPVDDDWRLDERTRAAGRAGVAAARAALDRAADRRAGGRSGRRAA